MALVVADDDTDRPGVQANERADREQAEKPDEDPHDPGVVAASGGGLQDA